jgi:hypothetical protein
MEDCQFTLNKNHPNYSDPLDKAMRSIIERLDKDGAVEEEMLYYENSGVKGELYQALELAFDEYWERYVNEFINN